MNTRSESSAKRSNKSKLDSNTENYIKMPCLSTEDKLFIRELIKESEFITSQVIKDSIKESEEKHFIFIDNLIKESEEKILSVIDDKINNLKLQVNNITERLNVLENKSSENDKLKTEIKDLKRKMLKQDNSIVASSIRIAGIPYSDNENLFNIFNNICVSLNVSTPQIDKIYRLKKIIKNNKSYIPRDEVIVAKLKSPFDKNFLLKSISKYKREKNTTLCLQQAGFDSSAPIYVNENLTPHNHEIFKAALNMKRSKKIKSTYTLRGLVYVKKFDADEAILIEFLEELTNLFRE